MHKNSYQNICFPFEKLFFFRKQKFSLEFFRTWQIFFQPTGIWILPFANSWIFFTLSAHCALANLLFCFFLQSNQLKVNSTGRGRISSTILWAIWNRWSWSRGVTKGKTEILPKFPRRLAGHVCQSNYIQVVPHFHYKRYKCLDPLLLTGGGFLVLFEQITTVLFREFV